MTSKVKRSANVVHAQLYCFFTEWTRNVVLPTEKRQLTIHYLSFHVTGNVLKLESVDNLLPKEK